MTRNTLLLLMILGSSLTSSGCGVLVVGGAATAASVAHDRRTTGTVVEDRAITIKTHQALQAEPDRLADAHINVASYDKAVLLTGEVPSASTRDWAGRVAASIENVVDVHNELAIQPPSSLASRSSDAWISTRAKASLLQIRGLPDFDPTRVKVVTERGIVYLLGLVTEAEGEAAANSVRQVGGVQQVVKLFRYIDRAG